MNIRLFILAVWLSAKVATSCRQPKQFTGDLPANLGADGAATFEEDDGDIYLVCPNAQWFMKQAATGTMMASYDYVKCIGTKWVSESGVTFEAADEFACTIGNLDQQGSCKIVSSGSNTEIMKDSSVECQPGQTTVIKVNGTQVAGQKLTCVKSGTVTVDGTTYTYGTNSNQRPRITCTDPITPSTTWPTMEICEGGGVWTEWVATSDCPETCKDGACALCGSCFNSTRVRTCLSEESCGCFCDGVAVEIGPCDFDICTTLANYTCCSPYKKVLNLNNRYWFCGLSDMPLGQDECGTTPPIRKWAK